MSDNKNTLAQAIELLKEFVRIREAADHASKLMPPFQHSALSNISRSGEELYQKAKNFVGMNPRDMDVQVIGYTPAAPLTDEQKALFEKILYGEGLCTLSGKFNERDVGYICQAYEEHEGGDIILKPLAVILDEAFLADEKYQILDPDGRKTEPT